MSECCMWACHQPATEERTTETTVDGDTFSVTYRLCAQCAHDSDEWAATHAALLTKEG